MPKNRWYKTCERCRNGIPIGAHYLMYAGRPWHPGCLIAHRKKVHDELRPRRLAELDA